MAASVMNNSYPAPVDSKISTICDNKENSVGGNNTRCNYAAEIENLDRLFGEIIEAAENRT